MKSCFVRSIHRGVTYIFAAISRERLFRVHNDLKSLKEKRMFLVASCSFLRKEIAK